ncbi:S9 family peptidase [Flammeovirga sp. SJP92]|uniref:S9 family peptidase n=1 Tax=Flammeovirga sp. SJP92 TaxID=1775430 RepID=UPI0009ED432C|nr:S9 family peptidase [Flammeovirga sp. SJP92]
MKNVLLIYLSLIVFMGTKSYAQNKEVPLLDREIFFGNPEIAGGQLSPDGKFISFLKEYNGTLNIWVKKFDEPFENAKPLTDNERPIGGYFWTYDGKYILYVKDNKGDENYNVYAVDPLAEVKEGVPEAKNLTPLKDVTVQIYQVSRNEPNIMMVGINDRDKAWHDLYKVDIATGERTLIFENKNRITGWNFDWDEEPRLAYRTNDKGHSEIMRIDGENKFTKIYETNLEESAYVSGWNKDNSQFYLVSNKGDVDLTTLYLMNPKTEAIEKVESDPKNKVDFGGVFLDDNTRELLYTSYTYDKRERLWKNKKWAKLFSHLEKQFKGREVGFSSFTKDYKQMLISVTGDKYAPDVYYYNSDTKKLIHQYTPKPKLKENEQYLAEMKPITYKSSDGLEIPGYLSIPKNKEAKNLPLVVLVHGGPKGPRDYWGYNSYVQMLANRGYAVLQPNFRASGGYGKSFLNAGNKQWGKLMQDDITYGVKYLISEGTVDASKVAIMGGSYGGYATLAGLAFTPDLYTCGVDIVGPSNLFTLLESIPPYWEAFRKSLYEMTGDPETEEGKKLIEETSPLFHVDKMKKPLLIVQGANDPRVKQAESDQIVIALRDADKEVEYLLADDEGHGFRKPTNNMAMWVATEKFLAKHLGGRYQEGGSDEVMKRLGEITVDVSKVTYTPKEEVETSASIKFTTTDIIPGEYDYTVTIEVQDKTIPMTSHRSVKKEGEFTTITDKAQSPMGEVVDKLFVKDMKPVKREIQQGGQTFLMNFGEDNIEMEMMGQKFNIPVEGAVLCGDIALDLFISRMPLREGFETVFLSPDLMTQKMKQLQVKVKEKKEEKIYVVSLTNLDNTNEVTEYTINVEDMIGVQETKIVPQMGNAKITTVLKQDN